MPALQPRRFFAPSFVVTVAAAAFPGCGSDEPIARNPPEPTASASAATSSASIASHEPIPDPVTAPSVVASARARLSTSWTVEKSSTDGKCSASYPDSGCPAGDTCNPPPPMSYACPKDVQDFPVTVTQDPDTKKCTMKYVQYHHVDCKPPMHCNPPPPSQVTVGVPCPK